MRASCLHLGGGAAPPQPPRLFKPGKLAWKHMNHVQNKTKHGVLGLAPRHVTAMQMGGAAPPPTPPLFSAGQARVEAYESSLKQDMGFSA